MAEYHFDITQEESGIRVDEFLARRFPLLSRTKLRSLVAAGSATRAGTVLSIGQRLKEPDVLQFRWDPARIPCCFPESTPLEVVWEDKFLLAVNKPSGMLVHPTRGVKRGTLTNSLLAHLNPHLSNAETVLEGGEPTLWPRFVHRLDRETSGLILIAKDRESAASLGKALSGGRIRKSYLAIVCGNLPQGRYEVREPICRFDDMPPHWRASADGQTAFSVIEALVSSDAGLSLIGMEPVTGRTNQLRIHSAFIGTPILGDTLYGGATASHLMLHAWQLDFPHPATGVAMSVSAPIPEPFHDAWPEVWPHFLAP